MNSTNWKAFAATHPEAARRITAAITNARARHRGWNGAAVVRRNIATGYAPDTMWAQIAREWTRTPA